MRTIAFFNNKGGVGKTTLVYHVAWMCSDLGRRVLAVDLDPQANLTSMFLDDDELEAVWPEDTPHASVHRSILPIVDGVGDIEPAPCKRLSANLALLPGDLGLSQFEDKLSDSWPRCLDGDKAAFRATTALYRIVHQAASETASEIVLIDVGPNLGAINRAALIAAEHVVFPLSPSMFSLQGLKNLGPTLRAWRHQWRQRIDNRPADMGIPLPSGRMAPAGYVVMQHVERKNRPVKAYRNWVNQIPAVYRRYVLDTPGLPPFGDDDPNRLGLIKNCQSLMPLAEDARKPMFKLLPADGAMGAHAQAVQKCYMDFKELAGSIMAKCGVDVPG